MNNFDKKNWQKYKFGDIAKEVRIAEPQPLKNGLSRYVGLEHIDPENLHIESWGDIADGTTFTRKFVKGQVLFGRRRAYLKKAALADFDGICSGDILVFEAVNDKLLPELLPFIVQNDNFFQYAVDASAGSLSPRVKFNDLAKFELTLPESLDEQKKLADLLWAGDRLIESYKYSHEKLFVFFKTKLYNHFSNKNLDQIEIGKLGKVLTGKTPSTSNQKAWDGDIPFVTPSDLTEGQKYFKRTERTVNSSYVKNYLLPENSILVTCIASIGQISISNQVVCTNQQINSIIPTLIEDAEFIYYSILVKMHSFKRVAGTSVVPIINKSTFEKFKINYTNNKDVKSEVVEDLRILEKILNLTRVTIQKSRKLNKKITDDIFS